ncbi:MAG: hypothetical protein NTV86_05490 [Planctomycetota bacterium]|nr:hypothetical protein [Planctomycetota bacterium]
MEYNPVLHLEPPPRDTTRPWPWWAYFLFAIVGPIILSIAFVRLFGGDFEWLYPFALPVWSYTVTIVKIIVMFAWITRVRRCPVSRTRAILGAWVFLVGGLHALFAAAANLLFSLAHPLSFLCMVAAVMAGVFYLHAYCEIRPARVGRRRRSFREVLSWACVASLAFGSASVILFFHGSPVFD